MENILALENIVKAEFRRDRVRISFFGYVTLRADKMYVSRIQAEKSMKFLQELVDRENVTKAIQ